MRLSEDDLAFKKANASIVEFIQWHVIIRAWANASLT
jgi:hypothetical protein